MGAGRRKISAGRANEWESRRDRRHPPESGAGPVNSSPGAGAADRLPWARAVALHLLPGTLTMAALLALTPALVRAGWPRVLAYQVAAGLVGFAGQLTTYELKAVEIAYEGHAAELNVTPLTAVILTAILTPRPSPRSGCTRSSIAVRRRPASSPSTAAGFIPSAGSASSAIPSRARR